MFSNSIDFLQNVKREIIKRKCLIYTIQLLSAIGVGQVYNISHAARRLTYTADTFGRIYAVIP